MPADDDDDYDDINDDDRFLEDFLGLADYYNSYECPLEKMDEIEEL